MPMFTFSVTGWPSEVACRVDSGHWVPDASPFSTAGLSAGAHAFYLQAGDPAGNVAITSRAFVVGTSALPARANAGPAFAFTNMPSDEAWQFFRARSSP